jgi:hypothetical protein
MSAQPSDKPNKKVRKKKPIKSTLGSLTDSVSLSGEESLLPISKFEQLNIEQLIANAMLRHKSEDLEDKKRKFKDVDYLNTIIEEYLSCFVLVGFSIQNEKVCIFNAHSSKDEGALVDYLRATFLEIVNNRP